MLSDVAPYRMVAAQMAKTQMIANRMAETQMNGNSNGYNSNKWQLEWLQL